MLGNLNEDFFLIHEHGQMAMQIALFLRNGERGHGNPIETATALRSI
ncbi:MAG: hypothetical protein R2827_09295 [Bdellovibrionales bacterium]